MLFVGSPVAEGKLRDLAFAPWSGSWGDDTLVGGAYRFGGTEGGELWAALYLRYDGFPWTRHLYTTFGLSVGLDYVTRLLRVERGTDRRPEPDRSHLLNFFSPEITVALPRAPEHEVVFRYIHRSAVFGVFGGVWEGANAFTVGYRLRF